MATTSKPDLSKQLIRKLGKQSDQALAEWSGVPVRRIRFERRRRQVPAFRSFEWTPRQIAILGTMPDKAAAKVIGVSKSAVFYNRVSLGIAPFGKSPDELKFHWQASHLKRLGKIPDAVLASELGVSPSVVTAKRHSMGISPSQPINEARKPWTEDELAMLGREPDTIVAARTGRGRRHVRAKRESLGKPPFQRQKSVQWTAQTIRKLGTCTDQELAKKLDVSLGTVALHRRRLRIQSCRSRRNTK